jgi:spermidine synthase
MVEHITVVEEDKSLLEVNIKFFNSFNREIIKNKKVNFVFSNCLEFIKQNNNLFDVVIINNTFSKGLKIFPFLKRSWKILEKNGYLIFKDDVSMLSSPEYYTNLLNLFNYRFSSIKIYQAWMLSLCKTCNYIMLSKDSVIKNKDNSEVEKILKLNLDKSLNFIDAKSYAYLMNPGKYVQDIQNKFNNINFVKTYKMDL